jgi:hypothetical protein
MTSVIVFDKMLGHIRVLSVRFSAFYKASLAKFQAFKAERARKLKIKRGQDAIKARVIANRKKAWNEYMSNPKNTRAMYHETAATITKGLLNNGLTKESILSMGGLSQMSKETLKVWYRADIFTVDLFCFWRMAVRELDRREKSLWYTIKNRISHSKIRTFLINIASALSKRIFIIKMKLISFISIDFTKSTRFGRL